MYRKRKIVLSAQDMELTNQSKILIPKVGTPSFDTLDEHRNVIICGSHGNYIVFDLYDFDPNIFDSGVCAREGFFGSTIYSKIVESFEEKNKKVRNLKSEYKKYKDLLKNHDINASKCKDDFDNIVKNINKIDNKISSLQCEISDLQKQKKSYEKSISENKDKISEEAKIIEEKKQSLLKSVKEHIAQYATEKDLEKFLTNLQEGEIVYYKC